MTQPLLAVRALAKHFPIQGGFLNARTIGKVKAVDGVSFDVTAGETLAIVERGEDAIRALGFRQFRVRHHGEIVRIEIAREELERALNPEMAAAFTRIFKALGFKFVALDLEGFRSGSMNSLLPAENLHRRAS